MTRMILAFMSLTEFCGLLSPSVMRAQSERQFVVYFRDGDAALTADANTLIERVVGAARAHHPVRIELIGVNDGLSVAREHIADKQADTIAPRWHLFRGRVFGGDKRANVANSILM
jgi:hypothetical protein